MAERSDGHALHSIMQKFHDAEEKTLRGGWISALESDGTELDLYRRHAEVVGLLRSVTNQIDGLPNTTTRERLWKNVQQWWDIVQAPDITWSSSISIAAHTDENSLDHLGNAADILAHNYQGTNVAPVGADLTNLREQTSEWIVAIAHAYEDLPDALRKILIKGLEHIVWLIDNAEIFGVARAVQAAESMTGRLIIASDHITTPEQSSGWKQRLIAFGAAIVYITGIFQGGTAAIESVMDFKQSVQKAAAVIDLDGGPDILAPKAIDPTSEQPNTQPPI